jgi:heme oxygenase (biliverdin-IX-beta and delta-forming)
MSTDAHARPEGPSNAGALAVPAPSHAERTRTLLASVATGTLCTLTREPAGYPYGSLTTFALVDGDPIFLISELAEHTRNLHADGRASLLVAESRPGDPLANGRVTLLGHCTPVAEAREAVRAAYLGRHPGAAGYADFKDFAFWRLSVSGVRYIGGYGRMSWVDVDAYRDAAPDPIAPDAAAILEHMNADHADALPVYCRAFAGVATVSGALMTSVDRLGFEMSVSTPEGTRTVRVPFPAPIASKNDARTALVALLREGRTKLAGG